MLHLPVTETPHWDLISPVVLALLRTLIIAREVRPSGELPTSNEWPRVAQDIANRLHGRATSEQRVAIERELVKWVNERFRAGDFEGLEIRHGVFFSIKALKGGGYDKKVFGAARKQQKKFRGE